MLSSLSQQFASASRNGGEHLSQLLNPTIAL